MTHPTADLTPRPSYTDLNFSSSRNLDNNVTEITDDWDPFRVGVLPPSSPPDYNNFSDQDSNSGLEVDQIEPDELDDSEGEMEDEEYNPCRGQQIEWVPGSIWETYAYAQHDSPSISWTPIGFVGSKFIKIRSKTCRRTLDTFQENEHQICSRCSSLRNSEELKVFMKRAAKEVVPRTNWIYLNARQLKAMLVLARKRARSFEIKVPITINIHLLRILFLKARYMIFFI